MGGRRARRRLPPSGNQRILQICEARKSAGRVMALVSPESIDRTRSPVTSTNATCFPSGEMAEVKTVSSGGFDVSWRATNEADASRAPFEVYQRKPNARRMNEAIAANVTASF